MSLSTRRVRAEATARVFRETPSALISAPRSPWRRPLVQPVLVLACSLAITVLIALYVGDVVAARDAARFQNAVQGMQDRIRARLQTYVTLLTGTAGLFAADVDDDMSQRDFHDYVAYLDLRNAYPGVQAIGFATTVRPGQSDEGLRAAWLPEAASFHPWPAPAAEAGTERLRTAVVFVEPLDARNRAALGFDFASEAAGREAMARATDDGRPAASARVTLAQEIDLPKQAGFVVYVPIYRGHQLPPTLPGRRQELLGFVFGAFRGDDLFAGIHGTEREPRVGVEVFDGDGVDPAHLLHRSSPPRSEALASRRTVTTRLNIFGRPWTLRLAERQGGELPVVPLVLLAGVLTSGLLFMAMLLQARGRAAAELTATNLRRSERSLRQSESRFRTLIERLPAAVSVYVDTRVAFCNPAMATILRSRYPGEIVGEEALTTVVADDGPKLLRGLAACRPTDDSGPALLSDGLRMDLRHRALSGETVPTEGFLLPILFDGLPAVLGVWEDVTQRRELAARMMQMDRMIAVGTLAAGVAHEINNPLAYVMANLDYVLAELAHARKAGGGAARELQEDEIAQALVEARDGAERMRRIVRDLKTYSRSDDDKRGPVDLRRAIEWAAAMAQNEIRHRARLTILMDQEPSPSVDGDEGRLGQVFLNLLVNAAQAIPEGAADKNEIRVTVRRDPPGRVHVEVRDTGVGIAPEVLGRIFDPFFTTKPVGVGTGLGLAISQRIVADYGGELRCDSAPGRGSTFRVTLPLSQGAVPEAMVRMASPPRPTPRPRVLVIDDEAQVLRAIQRALGPTHEVVAVARSAEALERLRAGERFDAILCDLMMPEMTGMELHGVIEQLSPAAARSMVFITGGAFTPRAREFLEQVQNPRLEKPFDLDTLRTILSRAAAASSPSAPRPA